MSRSTPPGPDAPYLRNQSAPVTLRQQMQAWLESLTAEGKSPRTVEDYRERVQPFVAWCEERGGIYAPQVSLAVLEGWQRWLCSYRKANGNGLAVNGQLSRLSAVKGLFRWLLKRHVILYNPAEMLVVPKAERRLPVQVFSEAETRVVLASNDTAKPLGLRNRAMLELLWSTGIRRMELVHLLLSDVDVTRGVLYVRQGKGRKDRLVPVGDMALRWLARYLHDVRPRLAYRFDSGHLFLTQKGTGLKGNTLTQLAGKAIRVRARLEKGGACHIFRHSMATQMLENGADTRHIQALLGHEKLDTTQVYTRVAIGPLQRVHARTHPAEKRRTEKQAQETDVAEGSPERPKR